MARLLLLTNALQPSPRCCPRSGCCSPPGPDPARRGHRAARRARRPTSSLVDGRRELAARPATCAGCSAPPGIDCPVLLVVTEGGLAVVTADWGMDDVLLDTAGPAEVEARLRLAIGRLAAAARRRRRPDVIRTGEVVDRRGDVHRASCAAAPLDLTYKEFELLKFLAQHPGRVFTREQLLQEVWGYDYFGGTRTVDVHVRRLRAKLGPEHEALIGTVRNVGYRFVPRGRRRRRRARGLTWRAPSASSRSTTDTASDAARSLWSRGRRRPTGSARSSEASGWPSARRATGVVHLLAATPTTAPWSATPGRRGGHAGAVAELVVDPARAASRPGRALLDAALAGAPAACGRTASCRRPTPSPAPPGWS